MAALFQGDERHGPMNQLMLQRCPHTSVNCQTPSPRGRGLDNSKSSRRPRVFSGIERREESDPRGVNPRSDRGYFCDMVPTRARKSRCVSISAAARNAALNVAFFSKAESIACSTLSIPAASAVV